MQPFSYAAPGNIEAALAAAGAPDTKYIAGGTDLVQLMQDDVERPSHIVGLDGLPLDRIEFGPDGARIGALVRMSDAADHRELRRYWPVIAEALLASASPQLRNMATMGGNLLQRTRCGYFRQVEFPCNKRLPGSGCPAISGDNRLLAILGGSPYCIATHPSDLAVALTALDAIVELHTAAPAPGAIPIRHVPLDQFYLVPGDTPQRETVIEPGEMITAILVPAATAGLQSHYLKVRDRASFEFALVSAAVAVAINDGQIARARIALGGVATKPWRLPAVEAALIGAPPTPDAFAAAAVRAADGAHPLQHNAFKIPLMQRAIVRALSTAIA